VPDPRRSVGAAGEDAAAGWYEAHGYAIVARNWRVRDGEIDLVARGAKEIVFCEVKARASDRYGSGFDAVTRTKQQRLRRLAAQFLAANPQPGCVVRFDVVAVTPGAYAPKVEVLEAAF
jgi:putative endonuclease